ncbi:hypothetical protein INR49_000833 [Caranx melampygus]|nr:hypothetical protein INR49_000833 [Caranx melampygus]
MTAGLVIISSPNRTIACGRSAPVTENLKPGLSSKVTEWRQRDGKTTGTTGKTNSERKSE